MSKHIPIIPKRFWLNISKGKGFLSVGIQHRIAWPPALKQTCHHSLLFRDKIYYQKEVT